MSVISQIQYQMMSDDTDDSERLRDTYETATAAQRALIDDVLITLCGWSLPTLCEQIGEPINTIDAEPVPAKLAND